MPTYDILHRLWMQARISDAEYRTGLAFRQAFSRTSPTSPLETFLVKILIDRVPLKTMEDLNGWKPGSGASVFIFALSCLPELFPPLREFELAKAAKTYRLSTTETTLFGLFLRQTYVTLSDIIEAVYPNQPLPSADAIRCKRRSLRNKISSDFTIIYDPGFGWQLRGLPHFKLEQLQ